MQPNFEAIRERIDKMPLTSELKTDFFEGIETCKEFSVRDVKISMLHVLRGIILLNIKHSYFS